MKIGPIPAIAMMSLTLVLIPAYQKLEGHLEPGHHKEAQEEESQHEESHHEEGHHEAEHKIVVTSPVAKPVTITESFVCQIHSHRHIEVCALESGYLEEIPVKEGQQVKQGETMFTILPTLYKAKLGAEKAEVQLAEIEYINTKRLFEQKVVARPEVALAEAKLKKAEAKMELTQAELDFTIIKAPFDGIIDHQHLQQGSLIAEGDILTTLSDNKVMWVYFPVSEARYLEYIANPHKENLIVELRLANGDIFSQVGSIGAIEADFNNETGNIHFRADFPNPDGLLRHGQTGTVLLSRVVDALVIPQRATFEILARKYAYVIEDADDTGADAHDADAHGAESIEHSRHEEQNAPESGHSEGPHGVVRQREIVIQNEQDDIFLISKGLDVHDKIILEGIRQVRDGDKVEYEFHSPEQVLSNLKYHAE
ncbi:MAG: efflux RND transporter periplasmic adaptor subunit [Fuerstiella sp.]